MHDFSNKTALVTGASRGIGRGIAEAFAKAGAHVIGTATSDAGAAAITAYLAGAAQPGQGLKLNVTDRASIEPFFGSLAEMQATPSILINNAGITRDNLLLRMKDEEWDAVIAANLTGTFALCRQILRPMVKARFGRIINITSVVGSIGNAGQANYAASKAGIVGFTKSLAREIGNRNITVNAVAPGFIDTDMTKDLSDDIKTTMLKQIPVNRFGAVEEVAAAILFLASDSAGYITGETLHVNGGMFMA
ncbi:MAG: 3-oxoacyl-ACP reductase FabG [Gammaproteobacteria bacterium]|nr:3-oxoacyl-ACP reductase FabG [Gammaproteobacteria bacterium]